MEKKYPASLFISGILLDFIRRIYLSGPGLVLLFLGIWINWCFTIGLVILLVNLLASVVNQIRMRKIALQPSDNSDFAAFQDALSSPDWHKNIVNLVESKIHEDSAE